MTRERKTPVEGRSKGTELMAHMAEVLAERLRKEGVQERQASEISLSVMGLMRFHFGGQLIYFPMEFRVSSEERAFAMLGRFEDGASINELAHEFEHSVQWVYKQLGSARDKRRAERRASEAGNGREKHDA